MPSTRPHDLLRLSDVPPLPADAPCWVTNTLSTTPWVVVRRAVSSAGRIAVGVRGSTRSQRYATEVSTDDVCDVVAPEDLAHVLPLPGREVAALATLQIARPLLDDIGLPWGPAGSVGFELATAMSTATPESDLDLLVRIPPGTADALPVLATLQQLLSAGPVRVDCQVETSTGAVALAELTGGQPNVLVRTTEGPRLVSRAVAVQ